jgi:hypothetical protein
MRLNQFFRRLVVTSISGVALVFSHGIVDSASSATILATTADGNGADTHLSNDGQQAQTTTHGAQTANDVRAIMDSRARIGMLRFDLSNVSGPVSDMQLQLELTLSTRTRDWVIYGLNDDGLDTASTADNWDELTTSYDNAPGIDLAGAAANSGNYALDAAQVTPLVTWNVQNAAGVQTSPTSAALDNFINAAIGNPNNKYVTLFLSYDNGQTSTDSNPNWAFASKENTAAAPPALVGVPEPTTVILAAMSLVMIGGWRRKS